MVFKGRFFSSKKFDTSSPDGYSNSPRSLGSNSNSPIRPDKKNLKSLSPPVCKDSSPSAASGPSSLANTPMSASKSLLKRKDSKGKDTLNLSKPTTEILKSSSLAPSNLKKYSDTTVPTAGPTSASFSPILASSLGLNKIKTRSGPLPQESFFSFGSRDKGVPLGSSNLSRALGSRGVLDVADVGKKKKEKPFLENVKNGSNSDGMSTENGPSRDQCIHVSTAQARSRHQNGECSSGATGFTADWWSVGVILFELIVGIPPFNAEHPQKIFDNILNRKIPWPRVPDQMSLDAYDLIDGLLTEDPDQRLGAGGALR